MTFEDGMENYFISYRKRYPHKSLEDAIIATRNWITGVYPIKGVISNKKEHLRRVEKKLEKLRSKRVK